MYERQDRRCRWSVAGIERYVVEGEVMEEGGNRSMQFFYLFAMRMEGFSFLQETTFVALGFFLNSLFLELYAPPL